MSPYRKNLLVGLMVLTAAALLGWMILKFGGAPAQWFAEPRLPISLAVDRADGLYDGSNITYKGVSVGRVTRVALAPDGGSVLINAEIDRNANIPANVEGIIYSQLIGGTSSIVLRRIGEAEGRIAANQRLAAQFVGIDLLPREFAELAEEIRLVARQLRDGNVVGHFNDTLLTIQARADQAGRLIDSLDALVGDEALRRNLHESVANFHEVSQTARSLAVNLELLSFKLDRRVDEVGDNASGLLTTTREKVEDLSRQLSERLAQVGRASCRERV